MDSTRMLLDWIEEDEDEEQEEVQRAAGAMIELLALSHQAQVDERNERRRRAYHFLRRGDLLPNPQVATPWQHLYETRSNRSFITTMGIDVATFDFLLNHFTVTWNQNPIPREDANPHGKPRLGGRSLDAAGALGLVLHWLSSSSHFTILELIFALIPATVSRYLNFSRKILLQTIRIITERHSALYGAIGTGDGLELPAVENENPEVENATYSGWKASHFIKNILFWSPKGFSFISNFRNQLLTRNLPYR
ncbi:hypothetical protein EV361DRAFT_364709 [Lentinula raphanica]|nr:hypothetical protein EV361DRAFT_364709 [Lentinula raphanica]